MKKNNNTSDLQYKKNKIKNKEDIISKSQIKQTKLETKINKLKIRKEKMVNKKTSILGRIFSYLIYDTAMISLLILFIKFIINKIVLSTSIKLIIYIIEMYIGISIISITGAILSSKIESFLKEHLYKIKLNKITDLIKIKEEKLKFETNLQEQTKHDITNIINNYEEEQDCEKNSYITYRYNNNVNNYNTKSPKKRIRKI